MYEAFHIVIHSCLQDTSREFVESTAYTLKEINTVAACSVFSTAVLCPPEVFSMVHEVWSRAFINTDQLFFAKTQGRPGTLLTMEVLQLANLLH